MADILNEPDFGNLRWEAYNGLPGLGDLYLQAMDALYAANPGLLFFIEGEQSPSTITTTHRLMPRMSAPMAQLLPSKYDKICERRLPCPCLLSVSLCFCMLTMPMPTQMNHVSTC